MITLSFKVDDYWYEKLNAFAINKRTYRTDVIKAALKALLQKGEIHVDEIQNALYPGSRTVTVTFKLEEEMIMRIDSLAAKYGINRSVLIRIALVRYLKENEKNETVHQAKVEKLFPMR